jgi:DNA-binding transcriptional regulator YhcF (GntR family)
MTQEIKAMSKYHQIADILKSRIEGNEFPCSGRIPSQRELAETYGVTLPTVNKAIAQLSMQGYLYQEHGKGTFVSKTINETKRRSNNIGLAFPIRNEIIDDIHYIQDYALGRNAILMTYAKEYSQDPAKEKMFLEQFEKENFCGVIALPSPIEPTNRDLFRRMREKGIKVALVLPYAENMDSEVTFFENWFHSGYLAAMKMKVAGFGKICFATTVPALPTAFKWFKDGISQAVGDFGMELLEDIHKSENISIRNLPGRTGIISTHTHLGRLLYDLILESGRELGGEIALCSRREYLVPECPKLSCLLPPRREIFEAAVDYILDPGISSTETVHRTFNSKYEEHGSVETKKTKKEEVS